MTREEAQIALANLKRYMSGGGVVDRGTNKAIDMAIEALAQPEIVRCKDCKHWREGTAFSYCDKLYGMGVLDALDYMVAENDYCNMAERR